MWTFPIKKTFLERTQTDFLFRSLRCLRFQGRLILSRRRERTKVVFARSLSLSLSFLSSLLSCGPSDRDRGRDRDRRVATTGIDRIVFEANPLYVPPKIAASFNRPTDGIQSVFVAASESTYPPFTCRTWTCQPQMLPEMLALSK